MYVCMNECMHACMYVCTYVCDCVRDDLKALGFAPDGSGWPSVAKCRNRWRDGTTTLLHYYYTVHLVVSGRVLLSVEIDGVMAAS